MDLMIFFMQTNCAFPIFNDDQDVKTIWNNSLRYNCGMRIRNLNEELGMHPAMPRRKRKHVGPGFSPDALEILFSCNASGLKPIGVKLREA